MSGLRGTEVGPGNSTGSGLDPQHAVSSVSTRYPWRWNASARVVLPNRPGAARRIAEPSTSTAAVCRTKIAAMLRTQGGWHTPQSLFTPDLIVMWRHFDPVRGRIRRTTNLHRWPRSEIYRRRCRAALSRWQCDREWSIQAGVCHQERPTMHPLARSTTTSAISPVRMWRSPS